MLTCHQVADYLLAKSPSDDEERDISPMKLLKLVYYAQGYSLALHDEPLFREPMQAWEHGPVVPELYVAYQEYRRMPIPPPPSLDENRYPEAVADLLDTVYSEYGQFAAWRLRQMTHDEPPWRDNFEEGKKNPIPLTDIAAYFKGRLLVRRRHNFDDVKRRAISLDDFIATL